MKIIKFSLNPGSIFLWKFKRHSPSLKIPFKIIYNKISLKITSFSWEKHNLEELGVGVHFRRKANPPFFKSNSNLAYF